MTPNQMHITGPKKNALSSDELIADFVLPVSSGPQQFSKVGTRNAMVIAVCSLALSLWPQDRRVTACIGSAGPTPIRVTKAEEFIAGALDWNASAPLPEGAAREFGALVEAAARPIDDVRGTARYRHHALGVLAVRTLTWAWEEHRCA